MASSSIELKTSNFDKMKSSFSFIAKYLSSAGWPDPGKSWKMGKGPGNHGKITVFSCKS